MLDKAKVLVAAVTVACLLSLGSAGLVIAERVQDSHAVCEVKQDQNTRTRDFLTQLLTDPKTPAATKASVTQLANKQFPVEKC